MNLKIRIAGIFLSLFAGLQTASMGQNLTYLALGDSYTIGEKVAEQDRWPVMLADSLNNLGYSFSEPQILAVTGWTTLDLKKWVKKANIKETFNLVSLLIGVNNQYRGYDIGLYKRDFSLLLSKAVELAGNRPDHVLVLSIPDYGVTPFAKNKNPSKISREIERYNEINKIISDQIGVLYVDITAISKKAGKDETLLAEDKLHPSGKMYGEWVDAVIPALLPELKTWKY